MKVSDNKTEAFNPRPHSFINLMDMYEYNYIRLRLFCGDIRKLPDEELISKVDGVVPVSLSVVERASHTTTLMLTYLFEDGDKRPDLKIQVYHDSRQADVISRNCRITGRDMRLWEEKVDSVLLCRWRLNRFLYKWLKHLEYQGHTFKRE